MAEIQDIRRARLAAWVAAGGGFANVVASRRLTQSQGSYLSQVVNGYSFAERAARNMEKRLGMPAGYLDRENDDKLEVNLSQTKPPDTQGLLAHSLSQESAIINPKELSWELLVSADLPERFSLVIRDEAMPPMRPGHLAIFRKSDNAAPGDVVLTADAEGNVYIRTYKERRPGHWLAVARNEDYQPLDSASDRLRILAVQIGHHWG